MTEREPRVAVIVPCYNEAGAIAGVVESFRAVLPGARVYVYDNNSRDGTAEVAARAGAEVRHESMQGKGHVLRRAFSDVDADVYLIVDGDGTYEAAKAPAMVEKLVAERLDMVVGVREGGGEAAYRAGHRTGNLVFNKVLATLFEDRFSDIFSGYRVFSRRFVKSFPALSIGFEIETELSVHAIELRMPTAEVPTAYAERAAGTVSKLNTYRDGLRILLAMIAFLKAYRPFVLFGAVALALALVSLILGVPLVTEWLRTGLVPRFPTAILATGIMLLAALSFVSGLILHGVSRSQLEAKRLHYLDQPAPG